MPVSKIDILQRISDERFSSVMARLKSVYSDDAYIKIVSKVKTVGYSRRTELFFMTLPRL